MTTAKEHTMHQNTVDLSDNSVIKNSEARVRLAARTDVRSAALVSAVWNREQRWDVLEEIERTERNPYELVWITKDEAAEIHYIYDHWRKLHYFVIVGSKREEIAEYIRSTQMVYSPDELFALVQDAKTPAHLARAIEVFGLGAPQQYDAASFDVIASALKHNNAKVRLAGVWATGDMEWAQFVPLLQQLAETDRNAEVRNDAKLALEGYALYVADSA